MAPGAAAAASVFASHPHRVCSDEGRAHAAGSYGPPVMQTTLRATVQFTAFRPRLAAATPALADPPTVKPPPRPRPEARNSCRGKDLIRSAKNRVRRLR